MGAIKWIGGVLGWALGGPLGGLLGFFVGRMFEGLGQAGSQNDTYYYDETAKRQARPRPTTHEGDFGVSLLVLSAAVIKADGKTLQSELDYVKDFVRRNFGDAAVPEAMRMLEQLCRQDVNIYTVGPQIARYMNYSQRLQLFHYLVQIAMADGSFDKKEKGVLEAIGSTIGLQGADINSVIAMFYKETSSAYTVLEISPNASDDEVRTAYRKMAMKNHPDKVATLGPDVQKAAAEKFRQVQEAYETIKKERGMS